MNHIVESILLDLQVIAGIEFDYDLRGKLSSDIEGKLEEGWYRTEIVEHTRNMEEINPNLDEDIALWRMAEVSRRVRARLAGEY